jgi:predicted MFS family arabinose efflux permease
VIIALLSDLGPWIIFILLLVRGALEATTKSSRLVALKRYTPKPLLEHASSVFNTSYYIGAGLGGLLGTVVVENLSLLAIALIDAGTFLLAALLYSLVRSPEAKTAETAEVPTTQGKLPDWGKAWKVLRREPQLIEYSVSLVILTGVYQGFHVIARTVIPIDILGTGPKGVTAYQVATCVGLVSAGIFVYRFMCGEAEKRYNPLFSFAATSAAMISTVFVPNLTFGLVSYLLFIFLFEVNYTKCMNLIISRCPTEELSVILPSVNSATMTAMVVLVFGGGWAMDGWGFVPVTLCMAGAALMLALVGFASTRRTRFLFYSETGEKI